jgi:pyruvate dehydrogenase phosphatase
MFPSSNFVVNIPPASSSENLHALEEVRDFSTTDMGRGGRERWTYRILREPHLSAELARMSDAYSRRCVDSVTLQPSPLYHFRSQDRCILEEWDMPGGTWLFNAVLDGGKGVLLIHD